MTSVQEAIEVLKAQQDEGSDLTIYTDDLDGLAREDVFEKMLSVKGSYPYAALQVVYMKRCMNDLLAMFPARMRGLVTDYGVFIKEAIEKVNKEEKEDGIMEVMGMINAMFNCVVAVARHSEECKTTLLYLYDRTPELFLSEHIDLLLDLVDDDDMSFESGSDIDDAEDDGDENEESEDDQDMENNEAGQEDHEI
ncbi:hypothetical protein QR680_008442 [Steinernema hermaphroditum]|uniref:Uncharacterized protein n=1 Tax=Steinernema hermaphroditum TaxID=289476 RepID=A0AA39M7M4_9BILA|nr:hypothetical protein QR680_008442 [Steinernema hermaphroditum]